MTDRQPLIIWLNIVLIALTFTALCARVGRRVFVVRSFSGHDALIMIAAISAFVFSICQIAGTSLGLGLHQKDVNPDNMSKLLKLVMASNVFYFVTNWAVKHALLLFYSEIVRDNKYRYSIWFMHFVAFGFGSSSILVDIFQCRPFNKAWNSDIPGWCVNFDIFFYVNGSVMLTTDLILYAMPVIFTWNLQLRRPQRIGLNFLFGLGIIVLGVSGARVKSVHMLAQHTDWAWWFADAMIWGVLENHLAIIVACAPSIKVVALLVFPRLASSLGKVVSLVSPSNSRSRSRASGSNSYPTDLESGTRKSDKFKLTPLSTPLPSPAYTAESGASKASRASRNFSRWFKSPTSPRHLTSQDSMEGGLVFVEDIKSAQDVQLQSIQKEIDIDNNERSRVASPNGDNDIHVEHTITVEDSSVRGSSENGSNAIEVASRAV